MTGLRIADREPFFQPAHLFSAGVQGFPIVYETI
jgi:hypothetical protein